MCGFSNISEVLEISTKLHSLNIPFSCATTYGAFSCIFFDVGDKFSCIKKTNVDGVEKKEQVTIENSKSVKMYFDSFVNDKSLSGQDLSKPRVYKKHFHPLYLSFMYQFLNQFGENPDDIFT